MPTAAVPREQHQPEAGAGIIAPGCPSNSAGGDCLNGTDT
jgi:hypothetical protein